MPVSAVAYVARTQSRRSGECVFDVGHEFVAGKLFGVTRHMTLAESPDILALYVSVLIPKMQERP
jgi:hypothetical protein